ncbi:AAA family ATPase [Shumkonia mesophila]|uniref:AAA family ATPase n=1 Tax=Shumkonia mesophila TaxID=2838854 RepID=UPI0029352C36|nr:AAA family ATPase [Shumkonia mesophila]
MLKIKEETTFTAEEMAEIRAKVRAIMEAEGLKQTDIARESGVAYGTFTGWLAGTYQGNNDKVAGEVQIWLGARVEKKRQAARIPEAPGFQMTPTSAEILDMLGYAQTLPGIVVVACGAGVGKTETCRQYAATNPNVWIVTMEPCSSTVYPMLSAIAEKLGLTERVMTRLSRAIGRKMDGAQGLLIVDEAQHLDSKALDQLRSLYDLYGVGIALVGNETVYNRLEGEGRSAGFAQLFSRIDMRKTQPRPKAADMCALIKAWGVEDAEEIRFLKSVARKPGALRVMTKVMKLASMLAAGAGETRAIKHIKAAFERLGTSSTVTE